MLLYGQMLHPGCCARLVSVVLLCRLCKYGNPDYSHLYFHVGRTNCLALPSLSTFKKLLKTQLFREHFPSYLALRLVLNLHLQRLHSCTSFSFLFSFSYFLCKVVFIVTPGFFIALSLTVLSLVRRFGQKRLLNDRQSVV